MSPIRFIADYCKYLLPLGIISACLCTLLPKSRYLMMDPRYEALSHAVFSEDHPIFDSVYVGSSKIWCAVDTRRINQNHPNQYSYNLGANWEGYNTKLVTLRDLARHKRVRRVVLEVDSIGADVDHPYFPFVTDLSTAVIDSKFRLNHIKHGSGYHANVLFQNWLPFLVKGYYGAARLLLTDNSAAPADLTDGYLPRENQKFKSGEIPTVISEIEGTYEIPEALKNISRLTQESNSQLIFLYLPTLDHLPVSSKVIAALKDLGTVIVPPIETLTDSNLWFDPTHLNEKGSEIFTRFIEDSLYPDYSRDLKPNHKT